MKSHRNLIVGVVLLLAGVAGLMTTGGSHLSMGGMMGRDGMEGMMKDMMGARLPPGINPADLPGPESTGVRLLARYCTQCHKMPGPGIYSA